MDPIHVPPPPKEAYNKNRPISDLIKAQLRHFQHIEQKLSPEQRPNIPHHELTTESAAASYIAALTETLRAQKTAAVIAMPRPQRQRSPGTRAGLQLAASADIEESAPGAREKRANKEKSQNKRGARGKAR